MKNVRAHEEWRAEYMLMGIKLREAEEKAKKRALQKALQKDVQKDVQKDMQKV